MFFQERLVIAEFNYCRVRSGGFDLRFLSLRAPVAAEHQNGTEQQKNCRTRASYRCRKDVPAHDPLATRLIVQPNALVSATGTALPVCSASIAVRKSCEVMLAALRLSSIRP